MCVARAAGRGGQALTRCHPRAGCRCEQDDIYALKQSQLEDQSQTITELERRLAALQEERDEMEERTRSWRG